MMRPMALAVPPAAPTGLLRVGTNGATLSRKDASQNETSFKVLRATAQNGPYALVGTVAAAARTGSTLQFTDATAAKKTTYFYEVVATDTLGDTQTYAAPAVGYPQMSADSTPVSITFTT